MVISSFVIVGDVLFVLASLHLLNGGAVMDGGGCGLRVLLFGPHREAEQTNKNDSSLSMVVCSFRLLSVDTAESNSYVWNFLKAFYKWLKYSFPHTLPAICLLNLEDRMSFDLDSVMRISPGARRNKEFASPPIHLTIISYCRS